MLQFKFPDKQYILSLDSLDLNFLSRYVEKPNDEVRALWSKSAEEEQKFYKVEILSEELREEEPFIESYKSYQCYICNTDVPHKFYKEHNRSRIHQNYKKLVENILENGSKQVNIDVDSVSHIDEKETFYCETCCKVVALHNKQNHKKSKYHLKSIENEQLASKFLEMYINDKNVQNEIKYETSYATDLDSECGSMLNTDWYDLNASKSEHDNNNGAYERNENDSDIPFNEVDELENFQQYLKEMIARYKIDFKLPIVEDGSIVIVTPKGYKEQITINAFHSYKKMDGFAFCLLCQEWVQDFITEHSASEKHVRNVFQPVNDNFIRKVVSNQVHEKQYSHCLICNERVLTSSNHVNVRPKHKKYLQTIAPNSDECNRNQESFKDLENCAISNVEPSESKLTKNTLASFSSSGNTDIETLEQKLIEYKKRFTVLGTRKLKCLVCSWTVLNIDSNIIEHVEHRLHKNAEEYFLWKNCLKKISWKLYYCNLCNKETNDFVNHINSHGEHNLKPMKRIGNKKLFKKFVYEDPFNQSTKAIECRQTYKDLLQKNKIIKSKQSFYCRVCFIKMMRISEIDHMFGERHRLALAEASKAISQ